MTVAGGMFIWNAGLGDIVNKYVSVIATPQPGVVVPITRNMTTTNGVNFGWLYDNHLVPTNQYGMATNSVDFNTAANADSDGDGFSNKDEYVLGSDPKDKFSLPTINYDSEKQELGWTPVNGWDYVIQAKTNLNASKWTDISTNKYPKSTYQITPELKQAFFKIEARKSP